VHDISDDSERVDPFDPDNEKIWDDENGVNIMGTPLGTHAFVTIYLQGKGLNHLLLLRFIKVVAAAGFPREAEKILKGTDVPRLPHILGSVQKSQHSRGWKKEMDGAHLST